MSDPKKEESILAKPDVKAEIAAEVISSEAILKGNSEVLIQHGDSIYRLRITQNGKLILCK
ncbi:hemin uptake protein HemP [uncultured Gimesia sp.]|uniref:hemin uptake protein HemP n=1 Tax=uncultured Gimesia sp. TaxID=1678688 RepID=UPI00260B985D|nr:hemin uptake protein HemP [uncultured Gimesia sp.]